MRSLLLLLSAWFCAEAACAQGTVVDGLVTSVHGEAFSVMGLAVEISNATEIQQKAGAERCLVLPHLGPVYVGEHLTVTGRINRRLHTLKASQISLWPAETEKVSGVGIIEAALPDGAGKVVRADGYLLVLTPKTRLTWTEPLKTLDDLKANSWIEYRGVQQEDGRVAVEEARVSANGIKSGEQKLHARSEFDPAAVGPGDRQSAVSEAFLGRKLTKLPADPDTALQARVARIGLSLVPAYQRQLPADDPTRINFRFQVVDTEDDRDAITLPSGIILVPYPVVQRLENDAQLAAVLADNIATVIEKQTLRMQGSARALTGATLAGLAGDALVPGLGLATDVATGAKVDSLFAAAERQSGRVSLWLLHDAGYDLFEAPSAWRLLEAKKEEPLEQTPVGPRALNLYHALGTTWRTVTRNATPSTEEAVPSAAGTAK